MAPRRQNIGCSQGQQGVNRRQVQKGLDVTLRNPAVIQKATRNQQENDTLKSSGGKWEKRWSWGGPKAGSVCRQLF